ncbi:MAG: flagellar basal-body rod protein FlgF [Betaproteobacteria bacterium]|nr:flagellar basal-body rod protein FlgF [Betaproteobacteria bacterium]
MDRAIYTAMTGAKSTLLQQASVGHNLANVSTDGFKAEMHRLRAVPVLSQAHPSRAFVVDASVANDLSSGPLQHTGRSLDAAIRGPGWFVVQGADGREAYTRGGRFEVTQNGELVNQQGLRVMGEGGPIALPPDNQYEIAPDGTISAVPTTGDHNIADTVGRLRLVNPPQVERGDDGLFRQPGGAPATADDNVTVASGYVEGSNVNVVEQMVQMISLARHFEFQTKLLSMAEQNDQAADRFINAR